MNCWINGWACPYGFREGILSTRIGFCKDCALFLSNREKIENLLVDGLGISSETEESPIDEEDQQMILENAETLHCVLSAVLAAPVLKISQIGLEMSDSEMGHLNSLEDMFMRYRSTGNE